MSDLGLRTVARVADPSPEFFEHLVAKENVTDYNECWVDLALPRDFEWSDEIGAKVVEYGIADSEGSILATFGTLAEAEEAKGKARIVTALSFDEDRPAEARAGKGSAKPAKVSEILSTTGEAAAIEAVSAS